MLRINLFVSFTFSILSFPIASSEIPLNESTKVNYIQNKSENVSRWIGGFRVRPVEQMEASEQFKIAEQDLEKIQSEKTKKILSEYINKDNKTSCFKRIPPHVLISQIIKVLQDPCAVDSPGYNLCVPAAFIRGLINIKPEKFAQYAIELAENTTVSITMKVTDNIELAESVTEQVSSVCIMKVTNNKDSIDTIWQAMQMALKNNQDGFYRPNFPIIGNLKAYTPPNKMLEWAPDFSKRTSKIYIDVKKDLRGVWHPLTQYWYGQYISDKDQTKGYNQAQEIEDIQSFLTSGYQVFIFLHNDLDGIQRWGKRIRSLIFGRALGGHCLNLEGIQEIQAGAQFNPIDPLQGIYDPLLNPSIVTGTDPSIRYAGAPLIKLNTYDNGDPLYMKILNSTDFIPGKYYGGYIALRVKAKQE